MQGQSALNTSQLFMPEDAKQSTHINADLHVQEDEDRVSNATISFAQCFPCVQVQDVGLIFLSAMASSIVHEGLSKKTAEADILGTTLLTLTASTFVVGLLIILVGESDACLHFSGHLM